ncbi:acyl carrier protein [Streptomonospora sediminis]
MDPGLALGVLGEVLGANGTAAGAAGVGARVIGSGDGAGFGSGGAAVGSGAGGNGVAGIGDGATANGSANGAGGTGTGVTGSSAGTGSTTGCGESCVVVADVDWVRFAATFGAERARPLISDIPEVANAAHDEPPEETGFAEKLGALSREERGEHLVRLVTTQAGTVLGYAQNETFPATKAFREVGFDSLMAVDLRNALARATGLTLPTTLVFDHPNATELAAYLHQRLFPTATLETVHADLDKLENALTELPKGGEAPTARIAQRLRQIADQFAGSAETGAGSDADNDLDSVGADELLSLIHDEFGRD